MHIGYQKIHLNRFTINVYVMRPLLSCFVVKTPTLANSCYRRKARSYDTQNIDGIAKNEHMLDGHVEYFSNKRQTN